MPKASRERTAALTAAPLPTFVADWGGGQPAGEQVASDAHKSATGVSDAQHEACFIRCHVSHIRVEASIPAKEQDWWVRDSERASKRPALLVPHDYLPAGKGGQQQCTYVKPWKAMQAVSATTATKGHT